MIQPSQISSRYLSEVWRNIDKCKNALGKFSIADTEVIRWKQVDTGWDSNFVFDGKFRFAALRGKIEWVGHWIPDGAFMWCNWISFKVSCFVWRARQDRIPSMNALITQGVQIQTLNCNACISDTEFTDHMLITCPFANTIWNRVRNWCGIMPHQLTNIKEILNFAADCGHPPKKEENNERSHFWCIIGYLESKK